MIFAELLRCIVDRIYHIYMYFVHTNAIETILRVGVVSPPSKRNNVEKWFFCELLRCEDDRINHIQMSFVHANAIKTIPRVGVVSPPRKNEYC